MTVSLAVNCTIKNGETVVAGEETFGMFPSVEEAVKAFETFEREVTIGSLYPDVASVGSAWITDNKTDKVLKEL